MPLSPVEEMSQSSRSNSTIRPTTARSVSNYQALSAEELVSKAIELHEDGNLKESTYHLRIAAKKGHATGMLLYALACRHGWGMRANQKEGVQWLRKAVDSAMLEVADDQSPDTTKPGVDFKDKKTHRAQFALGIYELGVSHLNGWGIEQDKALALRCFEIAGNWGDTDALSEAGFCYAEGIGCKKDLKKAAKFYRSAEAKGVSMIGNSW
jgi:TPR repeat protein